MPPCCAAVPSSPALPLIPSRGWEIRGALIREAGSKERLPIVTEIMSADKIAEFVEKVDLIQVGARNMQNFTLLKELGKTNVPILLKRGLSATIEEWLMSAEYIMSEGNENVILCERGIRTFETYTAIPWIYLLSVPSNG